MPITRAFFETAARCPGSTAVLDGERLLTYGELAVLARRAALRIAGATDREHVAVYLPSSAGFLVTFLGVLAAGRAVVPLNLFLAPDELAAVMEHAETDLVITCGELADRLPAGAAKQILVEELISSEDAAEPASREPDDLAVLLYTSGSTGQPKGVRLSHRNLLANARAAAQAAGFRSDDRVLGALPPFHSFALTATLLAPLLTGAAVSTLARFHPEGALDLCEECEATVILGVPSMYRLMARSQKARPRQLRGLRMVFSGGERLPQKIRAEFEAVFGTEIHEGYGLTECSPVVAINRPGANRPGTVGQPLEHLEVRIVGQDGLSLPAGEEGEIWVRGDSVMCGYHRDEKETDGAISSERWLRTGDLGRLDADGYLTITGRIKELIIVAGENVHPGEVEEAATSHPAVAECAALGEPDEQRGEHVVLFAVARPEVELRPEELKAHCRERLAGYKVPRRVLIADELPKLPTGKVNKRALAAQLAGKDGRSA